MSKPKAPSGLADAGSRLWRDVVAKYDLRADELVTLEAACRASDRIVDMERERAGRVTATGSMGQVVVHPLVAEIRAHEAQVTSLLARLKLPDDVTGATSAEAPRSTQARAAAQSRWAAAHGA
jgi:hypothetical protein